MRYNIISIITNIIIFLFLVIFAINMPMAEGSTAIIIAYIIDAIIFIFTFLKGTYKKFYIINFISIIIMMLSTYAFLPITLQCKILYSDVAALTTETQAIIIDYSNTESKRRIIVETENATRYIVNVDNNFTGVKNDIVLIKYNPNDTDSNNAFSTLITEDLTIKDIISFTNMNPIILKKESTDYENWNN